MTGDERGRSTGAGVSRWWVLKVSIGLALIAHAVVILGLEPGSGPPWPLWMGQSTAVAGGALSLVHFRLLRRAAGDISAPGALMTSRGLYRHVRHPMYLGDLLLMAGFALMCPTVLSLALVAAGTLALVRLSRAEDERLRARFAGEFDRYAARTRLLVPGLL